MQLRDRTGENTAIKKQVATTAAYIPLGDSFLIL